MHSWSLPLVSRVDGVVVDQWWSRLTVVRRLSLRPIMCQFYLFAYHGQSSVNSIGLTIAVMIMWWQLIYLLDAWYYC
jgi:hypothetical protein